MAKTRMNFATTVDSALLEDVRALAQDEGAKIQTLVDEALADLLEKRRSGKPRRHVMAAYQSSHARFGPLYEKLAK